MEKSRIKLCLRAMIRLFSLSLRPLLISLFIRGSFDVYRVYAGSVSQSVSETSLP